MATPYSAGMPSARRTFGRHIDANATPIDPGKSKSVASSSKTGIKKRHAPSLQRVPLRSLLSPVATPHRRTHAATPTLSRQKMNVWQDEPAASRHAATADQLDSSASANQVDSSVSAQDVKDIEYMPPNTLDLLDHDIALPFDTVDVATLCQVAAIPNLYTKQPTTEPADDTPRALTPTSLARQGLSTLRQAVDDDAAWPLEPLAPLEFSTDNLLF